MYKRIILFFFLFLALVCVAGCGENQEASAPAASEPVSTADQTPTQIPESQPGTETISPSTDVASEMEQIVFNGLTFEIGAQYEFRDDGDKLSIVFEKGVATMTVHYSGSNLSDREIEATVFNGALLTGFSERQNEEQNDVDINGVTAKATTCLAKADSTPWLNAMCLTVPTETGYVSFLYLQALEAESDYTDVFEALMESITVA